MRIAGDKFQHLGNGHSDIIQEYLNKLTVIEKEFTSQKVNCVNELFTAIKNETNTKERGALLSLKRYIANLNVNDEPSLNSSFSNYDDKLKRIQELQEAFSAIRIPLVELILELENLSRINFANYVDNSETFKKGLLLSSQILYENLPVYLKKIKSGNFINDEQIENGLLRYFTRMTAKATPFSTFCAIIPGSFNKIETNGTSNIFSTKPVVNKSEITLNKDIYGNIFEYLSKEVELRKFLLVELNPTVEPSDRNFKFLTAIEQKEVFQRLQINDVLNLIVEKLSQNDFLRVELNKLIDTILSLEEIDATLEEVVQYLDRLIEIGFIRLTVGIASQDAYWHIPLKEYLERLDHEKSNKIVDLLSKLDSSIISYQISSSSERKQILTSAIRDINACFTELGIKELKRANLPFYEDATSYAEASIPYSAVKHIEEIFREFVLITRKFAYPRSEKANMRHFFEQHYDVSKSVPLLQFYEDYYREHFKEHLTKQQKIQAGIKDEELKKYDLSNPFKLDIVKKLYSFSQSFSKLISDKWKLNISADEINISLVELEAISNKEISSPDEAYSVSIFATPVFENNKLKTLVIPDGKYLMGFGKYFSRFLYLFDEQYKNDSLLNNSKYEDSILAEICHDSNFNANLHPILVENEIVYPTSESGYSKNKISCNDIYVRIHQQDAHSLELYELKTNKKIIPLDLGFLNPMMRPPLFQLLAKFAPASNFSLNFPDTYKTLNTPEQKKNEDVTGNENKEKISAKDEKIDKAITEKSGSSKQENILQPKAVLEIKHEIVYRPRIVLENTIILSRKIWKVPAQLYPVMQRGELKADYFIRVNEWRIKNGIPDKVYIRVRPLPVQPKNNLEQKKNGNEVDKANQNKKTIDKPAVPLTANNENGIKENGAPEINAKPNENENTNTAVPINGKKKEVPKYSKDFYKPQYIDFLNPLFLNIIAKVMGNLKNYVVTIEEMLPQSDQLAQYEDSSYATEFVLQFDIQPDTPEQTDYNEALTSAEQSR